MTQKELRVFHTLQQWYNLVSYPDGPGHYLEMYHWAEKLVKQENRPILLEIFYTLPELNAFDIAYIQAPENKRSRNYGESVEMVADCARKMEKLIFLITHEGFEDMLQEDKNG